MNKLYQKVDSDRIHGNIRCVKKFAFFPITVGCETKWLQWVNIRSMYDGNTDHCRNRCRSDGWIELEFVPMDYIPRGYKNR